MSLYALLKRNGRSGFGYGSTALQVTSGLSLSGKTFVVTGCNSGLGLETARVLALRGARILGTARSVEKATNALAPLAGRTAGIACELTDPASILGAVESIKAILDGGRLDGIVGNAGIKFVPDHQKVHGLERHFFGNHIGHFLLITGLLDRLTPEGRVVMVSSSSHVHAPKGGIEFDNLSGDRGYEPRKAYAQSKIANILFAKELARQWAGTSRTANAVHPDVIFIDRGQHTRLFDRVVIRAAQGLFLKTVEQGAATTCYVVAHPGAAAWSGHYFSHCNLARPRADGTDAETARRLWEVSEDIAARFA